MNWFSVKISPVITAKIANHKISVAAQNLEPQIHFEWSTQAFFPACIWDFSYNLWHFLNVFFAPSPQNNVLFSPPAMSLQQLISHISNAAVSGCKTENDGMQSVYAVSCASTALIPSHSSSSSSFLTRRGRTGVTISSTLSTLTRTGEWWRFKAKNKHQTHGSELVRRQAEVKRVTLNKEGGKWSWQS